MTTGYRPLISFIIPAYNAAPYIERCMLSVLRQTYQNFEVICVDDGSTDGTGKMLDNFACEDKRIRIIHQQNRGLVRARKIGAAEVVGDYVSYVDADDEIAPTRLEELLPAMAGGADLILTDVAQIYGDGYQQRLENFFAEGFYSRADIETKILPHMMDEERVFRQLVRNTVCGGLFRKELIKKCLPKVDDSISVGEDCAIIASCLLSAQSMHIVYAGVYYYYKNHGSMCHTINKDKALAEQRRSNLALLRHLRSIADGAPSGIKESLARQMMLLAYYNILPHDYELFADVAGNTIFPFAVPSDSRIILYGAGAFGMQLHRYLTEHGGNIALWCDRSYKKRQADGLSVISPTAIRDESYDYILMGIAQYELAAGAKEELIATYGADIAEKIKLINPAELTGERLKCVLARLKAEVAK